MSQIDPVESKRFADLPFATAVRRRRTIRRVGLCALVSLVLLTSFDVALRLSFGFGDPVLIQADKYCGYILKPNQNIHRFSVSTFINRYGMRSGNVTPDKPVGTTRIMFLGDSITYGTTQVDQSQIFSELVHKNIEQSIHGSVQVLNASAGAWAIGNELAYAESRGLFGSDLLAVVINRGDLPQQFSTLEEVGDEVFTKKPPFALSEVFTRAFKMFHLGVRARVDAGIYVSGFSASAIRANLDRLATIQKIAQRQNARMVIIYLPLRRELKTGQSSSAPAILLEWAAGKKIQLLDVTSAETALPENAMVIRDHAHLNAVGHALISKQISHFIIQNLKADS